MAKTSQAPETADAFGKDLAGASPVDQIGADALLIVTDADAERTGGFAAIGSIHDTQALLRGETGTRVALETPVHAG